MRIEFENLFLKACIDGINIFTGAGFSINAYNRSGTKLPLANELSMELADRFGVPKNLPLPHQSSIIESRNKEEFYAYLKEKMYVEQFDIEYNDIENLSIKNWYTTNIDNLPKKKF